MARRFIAHSNYHCAPCARYFVHPRALIQHDVARHFGCATCGRCFQNDNNLRMHQISHKPLTHECYGYNCSRLFPTLSAMYIHLEAGSCPSGCTRGRIVEEAYNCWASDSYTTDRCDGYDFECEECGKEFRTVSGLLQHVESDACNASLDDHDLGELNHHIYLST